MTGSPHRSHQAQEGVALLVAVLILLLLSSLAAAVITVARTDTLTSYNYKVETQARYLAEAGAQRAADWLGNTYTAPTGTPPYDTTKQPVLWNGNPVTLTAVSGQSSNYPYSNVQTSFAATLKNQSLATSGVSGTYSVSATLLRSQTVTVGFSTQPMNAETWQVTSQGTVPGVTTALVEVMVTVEQRPGQPLFGYGITATGTGCGVVTFASNNAMTDSFDSSLGTYATTQQNSGGNLASNGNVSLNGGATINGSISTPLSNSSTSSCNGSNPNQVSISGGSTVGKGIVNLNQPIKMPGVPAMQSTPPTTTQNVSSNCSSMPGCTVNQDGSFSLASGTYGNLVMNGNKTVHLSSGTYSINSLAQSGQSLLTLDSTPVIIQVAGVNLGSGYAVDLTGGGLQNPSGIPGNFEILYGGSSAIKLSGHAATYGVVYAPNAPVTFTGGTNWYGAVVGKTVTVSGGSQIHYDRSLLHSDYAGLGPFTVLSYSRSKY